MFEFRLNGIRLIENIYILFNNIILSNPSSDLDSKYIEKLNVEIAGVIERLLKSPSALNLSSFCLVPKRIVWIFYVDILVLDYGGNLFDAVSIATRAALSTTTYAY